MVRALKFSWRSWTITTYQLDKAILIMLCMALGESLTLCVTRSTRNNETFMEVCVQVSRSGLDWQGVKSEHWQEKLSMSNHQLCSQPIFSQKFRDLQKVTGDRINEIYHFLEGSSLISHPSGCTDIWDIKCSKEHLGICCPLTMPNYLLLGRWKGLCRDSRSAHLQSLGNNLHAGEGHMYLACLDP